MLIHDVALDGLHVVFGVDRAGLVGEDGETHQGVFDVGYLDSVPGMTVLAPSSYAELEHMLERAVLRMEGPVAVRYPRGGEGSYTGCCGDAPSVVLKQGTDITLVGYGMEINEILLAAQLLEEQRVYAEVIKLNTITPLEERDILVSVEKTGALIVAEDCAASGSVGQRLAAAMADNGVTGKVCLLNCGDSFVPHGAVSLLKKDLQLDGSGIFCRAMEVLGRG